MAQQLKNSSKIQRVKTIKYQILKTQNISTFTDKQLVLFAQSILNASVNVPDLVIDLEMPTNLFGVDLDWSMGAQNDYIVKLSKGSVSITQDLTLQNADIDTPAIDPELSIYNTALGLARDINSESSIPIINYNEINISTTLSDAQTIAITINL